MTFRDVLAGWIFLAIIALVILIPTRIAPWLAHRIGRRRR